MVAAGSGAVTFVRLPCASYAYSVTRFVAASLVPAPVQAAGSAGGVVPTSVQLRISLTSRPSLSNT